MAVRKSSPYRWRDAEQIFLHLHNPSVQCLSSSLSLCALCLRGVFPLRMRSLFLFHGICFFCPVFSETVIHQIVCRLDSGLSRARGVLTLRLGTTEPSTHHCDHKFVRLIHLFFVPVSHDRASCLGPRHTNEPFLTFITRTHSSVRSAPPWFPTRTCSSVVYIMCFAPYTVLYKGLFCKKTLYGPVSLTWSVHHIYF